MFNAPIEVRDTLFDGAIVEPSNGSWSPTWECEGQSAVGHPEQGICKHPQVALDPGESVVLEMEIEAPNSFIAPSGSQVKCGYTNKAEILRPAGGSPKNTNAGDDTASAEVKFAPFEKHGKKFCELGLTAILVAKETSPSPRRPAPVTSHLAVRIVRSPSPSPMPAQAFTMVRSSSAIRCSMARSSSRPTAAGRYPWVCEGQSAAGHPEQGICTHPPVLLDPGESVELELEMEAPNSFVAPSGSQVKCGYENKIEIFEPAGGSREYECRRRHGLCRGQVRPVRDARDDVLRAWLDDAAGSAVCPQGWSRTPVAGKCCPPRSSWDGRALQA